VSLCCGFFGVAVDARSLLHGAAALQELQHPHVVRVFGLAMHPSMAVVMEYVSLGPLSRYVCEDAVLAPRGADRVETSALGCL
jgi:serine/threonine protein kinase